MQKGVEVGEAFCDGKGASHPFKGGVVMAIRVDSGGPREDVEVIVGEIGVVVELGLEEVEKVLRCERGVEMVLEEVEEVGVVR